MMGTCLRHSDHINEMGPAVAYCTIILGKTMILHTYTHACTRARTHTHTHTQMKHKYDIPENANRLYPIDYF
jgi:hypothetical protein